MYHEEGTTKVCESRSLSHRSARARAPASNTIDLFFREQYDMLSEILLYLDARSLFNIHKSFKQVALLLRYDHIFSSVQRMKYVNSQRYDESITSNMNSFIILDKIAQVYNLQGDGRKADGAFASAAIAAWRTNTKPSPLRLLQLVNGKKCECCERALVSPFVWAGSGRKRILLPSLSFGEFCCTTCIYDRENRSNCSAVNHGKP